MSNPPDERDEIDPEKLRQFAQGARTQTTRKLPFDDLNPDGPRDKAFRFETNAYERAMFKYLAAVRGKGESVAELIRKFARERAVRELAKTR